MKLNQTQATQRSQIRPFVIKRSTQIQPATTKTVTAVKSVSQTPTQVKPLADSIGNGATS